MKNTYNYERLNNFCKINNIVLNDNYEKKKKRKI